MSADWSRYAKALQLCLDGGTRQADGGNAAAERLRTVLAPYRSGPCPVRLNYRNGEAAAALDLPESWRVRLDDALLAALRDWLRAENVTVAYS